MSTPTRRRRQRSRSPELVLIAATALGAVILLRPGALIWLVITAATGAVCYALGRSHDKPAPRKPMSEFRQAKRAAARQGSLRAKSDAKASRNGWLPPANPQLTTLTVSRECAGGQCHACEARDCEHCDHPDSAEFVRRNEEAYDQHERASADGGQPGTPGYRGPEDLTEPPF